MKTQPTTSITGQLSRSLRATFVAALLPAFLLLFTTQPSHAGSATWAENASYAYDEAANWTPQTVPAGRSDTATFATSVQTFVYLSDGESIELNGFTFNPGADAFTMSVAAAYTYLTFSGVGIVNNSGVVQTFWASGASDGAGYYYFNNRATAGSLTSFVMFGGSDSSQGSIGFLYFNDASSAGSASVTLGGGTARACGGGYASFKDGASAANATFMVNGGTAAGSAGGHLIFSDRSTASQASLTANTGGGHGGGGVISFEDNSLGDSARVQVFGNGNLQINAHNAPGLTIGSLEGNGKVSLGANNLGIGSNDLDSTFGGVINGSGSLTKLGAGNLTLSNANTYSGGTTVTQGTLSVGNRVSATGSGPVAVESGTLAGTGPVAGAVTLGIGTGPGAVLSPESKTSLAILTIQSALTFNADATYKCGLNSNRAAADQVAANGVTINGGTFSIVDKGTAALPPGIVFTVISNIAATPIGGTFSNLPDGSTITVGNNTFQANYEGGDGNDLTLTVVP